MGGGLKNKSKLVLKFQLFYTVISLISWQSNCCLYLFNFVLESSIFHHHSDTKTPFSGPAVKPQTIIRARLMSVEAKAERCTETSLQYCCMPSIRAYSKPSKFCVRETHKQTTKFQTIFTFLLQISDEKNKQWTTTTKYCREVNSSDVSYSTVMTRTQQRKSYGSHSNQLSDIMHNDIFA